MKCPRCHRYFEKPDGTGWACARCEEAREEQSREAFNDMIAQDVNY